MQRRHVLAGFAAVLALSLAAPAVGAPSVISIAKRALSIGQKANKKATTADRNALAALKQIRAGVPTAVNATNAANAANAVKAQSATTATSATNAVNATNALTAAKATRADTAAKVDQIQSVGSFKKIVSTTSAATKAAAASAAPEVPLFKFGALDGYAKCFRDQSAPKVYLEAYARTTLADSLLVSSGTGALDGSLAYLQPATAETDRSLLSVSVADNSAGSSIPIRFSVTASDGSGVTGVVGGFVKAGTPATGNGMYGPGDVCVVTGFTTG
jgi:hypothetical protein